MGRNTWVKRARAADGDLPSAKADDENALHAPPLPIDPSVLDEHASQSRSALEPNTRRINVGGKATLRMGKGDRLLIETPGGGGWGAPDGSSAGVGEVDLAHVKQWAPRGSIAEREALQAGFGGF